MSLNKSLFSFAFAAVMAFPVIANADVFVWKSQEKDVALAFPDRWSIVGNIAEDEILRIAAPAVTGRAEDARCRLRVKDDKRFMMHPVSHSRAIQREHFSEDFWNEYSGEFKNYQLNHVQDNAGLGHGFASYADITYEDFGQPRMIRRGIAFATLYQNQLHVFECSSEIGAFEKWYPLFLGVVKSVDFKGAVPFKRGYYRHFYDGETVIHGRREIDNYTF